VPRNLKREPRLLQSYVNARLQYEDSSDCEPLLRRALRRSWDEELVRLYGLVEGASPGKQVQFAERLLSDHPGEAVLYLTLGRLCKKHSLWGKARTYLEESLARRATVEACQELAQLLEQQGEHSAAGAYFQRGLALATGLRGEASPILLERPEREGETVEEQRPGV